MSMTKYFESTVDHRSNAVVIGTHGNTMKISNEGIESETPYVAKSVSFSDVLYKLKQGFLQSGRLFTHTDLIKGLFYWFNSDTKEGLSIIGSAPDLNIIDANNNRQGSSKINVFAQKDNSSDKISRICQLGFSKIRDISTRVWKGVFTITVNDNEVEKRIAAFSPAGLHLSKALSFEATTENIPYSDEVSLSYNKDDGLVLYYHFDGKVFKKVLCACDGTDTEVNLFWHVLPMNIFKDTSFDLISYGDYLDVKVYGYKTVAGQRVLVEGTLHIDYELSNGKILILTDTTDFTLYPTMVGVFPHIEFMPDAVYHLVVYIKMTYEQSNFSRTRAENLQQDQNRLPNIVLLGDVYNQLFLNDTWTDPGVEAHDALQDPLTIVSTGTVDTSTPGIYEIIYSATDTEGFTTSIKRLVEVFSYERLPVEPAILIPDELLAVISAVGKTDENNFYKSAGVVFMSADITDPGDNFGVIIDYVPDSISAIDCSLKLTWEDYGHLLFGLVKKTPTPDHRTSEGFFLAIGKNDGVKKYGINDTVTSPELYRALWQEGFSGCYALGINGNCAFVLSMHALKDTMMTAIGIENCWSFVINNITGEYQFELKTRTGSSIDKTTATNATLVNSKQQFITVTADDNDFFSFYFNAQLLGTLDGRVPVESIEFAYDNILLPNLTSSTRQQVLFNDSGTIYACCHYYDGSTVKRNIDFYLRNSGGYSTTANNSITAIAYGAAGFNGTAFANDLICTSDVPSSFSQQHYHRGYHVVVNEAGDDIDVTEVFQYSIPSSKYAAEASACSLPGYEGMFFNRSGGRMGLRVFYVPSDVDLAANFIETTLAAPATISETSTQLSPASNTGAFKYRPGVLGYIYFAVSGANANSPRIGFIWPYIIVANGATGGSADLYSIGTIHNTSDPTPGKITWKNYKSLATAGLLPMEGPWAVGTCMVNNTPIYYAMLKDTAPEPDEFNFYTFELDASLTITNVVKHFTFRATINYVVVVDYNFCSTDIVRFRYRDTNISSINYYYGYITVTDTPTCTPYYSDNLLFTAAGNHQKYVRDSLSYIFDPQLHPSLFNVFPVEEENTILAGHVQKIHMCELPLSLESNGMQTDQLFCELNFTYDQAPYYEKTTYPTAANPSGFYNVEMTYTNARQIRALLNATSIDNTNYSHYRMLYKENALHFLGYSVYGWETLAVYPVTFTPSDYYYYLGMWQSNYPIGAVAVSEITVAGLNRPASLTERSPDVSPLANYDFVRHCDFRSAIMIPQAGSSLSLSQNDYGQILFKNTGTEPAYFEFDPGLDTISDYYVTCTLYSQVNRIFSMFIGSMVTTEYYTEIFLESNKSVSFLLDHATYNALEGYAVIFMFKFLIPFKISGVIDIKATAITKQELPAL